MNWPTFAEVEAADIEQLREWINGLPGCDIQDQRAVVTRITQRIVATWPKRTRPLMPVEIRALADLPRPEAVPSVTKKRDPSPSVGPEVPKKTKPEPKPEPEPQGSLFFLNALKS